MSVTVDQLARAAHASFCDTVGRHPAPLYSPLVWVPVAHAVLAGLLDEGGQEREELIHGSWMARRVVR